MCTVIYKECMEKQKNIYYILHQIDKKPKKKAELVMREIDSCVKFQEKVYLMYCILDMYENIIRWQRGGLGVSINCPRRGQRRKGKLKNVLPLEKKEGGKKDGW